MLHCRGLKNIVYFKEDYRDEYEFLKEDEEKKKGGRIRNLARNK